MSNQPGDGCEDPREIHYHWCRFCGAVIYFSKVECYSLYEVPPCPRCDEADWGTEIDELTLPNYQE